MGLNKIKTVMTLVLLLGISLSGFAQEPVKKEEKEKQQDLNRQMTLEREYDPIVQDAAKITTQPAIREVNVTKRPITYSDYAVPLLPRKEMNTLPPGKLIMDIPHPKRDGYLHFGGGMHTNLMGDFGYHILNTERDLLGVWFSHRSTNGNVKFEGDSIAPRKAKFNDNLGGLDFKHHFDKATFSIGGKFGYSTFNYYGMPTNSPTPPYIPPYSSIAHVYVPEPIAPLDSIYNDVETNQETRLINVYSSISSDLPASMGYHIGVDYTNFNQKYSLSKDYTGMTENHIGLCAGLRSPINDGKSFGVDLKANVLAYTAPELPVASTPASTVQPPPSYPNVVVDSAAFKTHVNATLTPYYRIESDTWKLFLGVNLMLVSQNDKITPFVSPNIKLDVPFADWNIFYADLGGGIESNSMTELSRINRYVNPAFTPDATKTWADLQLGVRSSAATGFWFDIFAGYKYAESDVFFNPSNYYLIENSHSADLKGFNNVSMVFQPTSQRIQAGLTLKYDYMHVVDFYLKGVYNHYNLKYSGTWKDSLAVRGQFDEESELKPYGKPDFTANAGINVRPVKPLTLSLDYCIMSGMYAYILNVPDRDVKMKTINDLRFRASWKFNDMFSLYAQCNNVLFQRQSLYYGYPLQPFTAMGGFNINF